MIIQTVFFFFLKYRPVQISLITLNLVYVINLLTVRYKYTSKVCSGDFLQSNTIASGYLQNQGNCLLASAWIIMGELCVAIVLSIRYWINLRTVVSTFPEPAAMPVSQAEVRRRSNMARFKSGKLTE